VDVVHAVMKSLSKLTVEIMHKSTVKEISVLCQLPEQGFLCV